MAEWCSSEYDGGTHSERNRGRSGPTARVRAGQGERCTQEKQAKRGEPGKKQNGDTHKRWTHKMKERNVGSSHHHHGLICADIVCARLRTAIAHTQTHTHAHVRLALRAIPVRDSERQAKHKQRPPLCWHKKTARAYQRAGFCWTTSSLAHIHVIHLCVTLRLQPPRFATPDLTPPTSPRAAATQTTAKAANAATTIQSPTAADDLTTATVLTTTCACAVPTILQSVWATIRSPSSPSHHLLPRRAPGLCERGRKRSRCV